MSRDTAKEWIGSYTAVPLKDSAENVMRVITIIICDVTDKKQTEDLLENKILSLDEANIAVKIIFKNSDPEKREAEENTTQNFKSFIDPLLEKIKTLTPTEQQIVHLVREGKSNKEIAELLNISNRTVETHRRNIRRKIGINNKKTNLHTLLSSHR